MSDDAAQGDRPPLLRIVRGDPTAEEVGALVAVLAAAAAAAVPADVTDAGPSPWARPALMHRHPVVDIGPGSWQRSLR